MDIKWVDNATLNKVVLDYIKKVDVLLDIGYGVKLQKFFQPRVHICCEPDPESVHVLQNKLLGASNVIILQGNGQDVINVMPDGSVDSIFLIDVIGQLEKAAGRDFIQRCEIVARRQIVIFTALGPSSRKHDQIEDEKTSDCSRHQKHGSCWTPEDFDESWEIIGSKDYYSGDGTHNTGAFWAIKNLEVQEQTALPLKIAVLSSVFPPNDSGQAIMLYRLLHGIKPEDYCLLSSMDYSNALFPYVCLQNSASGLLAKFHNLPPEFQLDMQRNYGLRSFKDIINIFLKIFQRAGNIAQLAKEERCEAILACSGDLYDLPAAYIASRLYGIKFYAYMFDYYGYQPVLPLHRTFTRFAEPLIVKKAAGTIVPNEFLRDEYSRLYGVTPTVVRNSVEILDDGGVRDVVPWPEDKRNMKIIYTGQVYQAHYDAFLNLVSAILQLGIPGLKLHIYTALPIETLKDVGIRGPVVFHNHLPQSKAQEVQRRADILFLPLAFNTPYPEIIRTSAPSKTGEYLASERPILAHVPEGSFISWYFKKHQCGLVVDQNDPKLLAEAIRRITEDENLRFSLVKNARARAEIDFSLESARSELLKLFHTS